jgi:hypothetical protein
MGTEEDKPNNAVLITIFVLGAAAMLGGSAAIVGMTRTEMDAQSQELSGYADLDSVRDLRATQNKQLREATLPIDKARETMLADIQRSPRNASWATPELSDSASAGGAPAVGGASAGGTAGAGAEAVAGATGDGSATGGAAPEQPVPAETAAPPEATATTGAPTTVAPQAPTPQVPPSPAPGSAPTD